MGQVDTAILIWIQTFLSHPILIQLFYVITRLGDGGIVWLGFAAYFGFIKKKSKKAIMIVLALLVSSFFVDLVMKNIFMRPRPFESYSIFIPRMVRPSSYSFPSGHSATSFACAKMIDYLNHKLGKFAYLLAGLIALSRVILCVHYPSDILCGIVLGIGVAKGINYFVRKADEDENNLI